MLKSSIGVMNFKYDECAKLLELFFAVDGQSFVKRSLSYASPLPKKAKMSLKARSYKKWTEQVEKALVEFIGLHRDLQYDQNSEWPSMKSNSSYW